MSNTALQPAPQPLVVKTISASAAKGSVYTTFKCTQKIADALASLEQATLGFATVHDYRPSSEWDVIPTQRVNAQIGWHVSRLYGRQIDALQVLPFADVDVSKWVPNKGRTKRDLENARSTPEAQFLLCRDKMINAKRFDVEREEKSVSAYREGHKNCYCIIRNSIKVHFVTETVKGPDNKKLTRPVLDADGHPTVDSINIPYLERSLVTIQEGKRKVRDSGSKVLMDKAIERALPKSLRFKSFTLKSDNFSKITFSNDVLEVGDLYEV